MPLTRAKDPFRFKTQLSLVRLTGLKAVSLTELRDRLREVPPGCLFHHTHHYLQQHQYLTPEPPNDFAYWVTNVLQEDAVGEQLAAVDTIRFSTLEDLRAALLEVLDRHLASDPVVRLAPPGEAFYFMSSVRFSVPTAHAVHDLAEFLAALRQVSIGCLYNHVFGARLRPPFGTNDFSFWLGSAIGEKELAAKIDKLDPYTQTMEGLRANIIRLIERRLA